MASIYVNQEPHDQDDVYEDMDSHNVFPEGGAQIAPSQSTVGTTFPPPLPPRASSSDRYTVKGNPSYLTNLMGQMETESSSNQVHRPSSPLPPPPYDTNFIPRTNAKKQKSLSVSSCGPVEGVTPDLLSPRASRTSFIECREDTQRLNAMRPSGYNIMNLFWRGNIIFLVPANSTKLLPLTVSGKTVRGGGFYNDDSRFEVVVPREHSTESVVALRNVKHKERFLCINSKGKIIARNGYKDSCDFFVSVKGSEPSPTVYFESARSDSFYLGVKDNNSVVDAANDITPESEEAQFTIIADRIQKSVPASELKVFEINSIMNQVHNESVIRLFSHRRYLAIDIKGRVMQTHNKDDPDCWFMVFDRGMGVVSLRSYNYPGYWLKIQESQELGKGMLGPEALFVVKETQDHLLSFESLLQPGIFVSPPVKKPKSLVTFSQPEFTIEIIK